MNQASFRFYAELNDFLSPGRRRSPYPHRFEGNPSIKHALESLGVPHPEVDLILANGASVDFSYPLQDGDRISVYPRFRRIDIAGFSRVRPAPLETPRFILDNHLGRLAAYLRMLGFDTLYQNDFQDDVLARRSNEEARILLTRDRGLLMRSLVTHGYCIRTKNPRRQVVEVLERFDLFAAVSPFKHCLRCNGALHPVPKAEILHRLEPKTRKYYDHFLTCQGCRQIYWKGSHYRRMSRFIRALLQGDGETAGPAGQPNPGQGP